MLLSDDGLCTHAIMREAGVSKTVFERWQDRFVKPSVQNSEPKKPIAVLDDPKRATSAMGGTFLPVGGGHKARPSMPSRHTY